MPSIRFSEINRNLSQGPLCLEPAGLVGAAEHTGPPAVLVDRERVLALGEEARASGARRIELPGLWLSPGVIDAHVHLHLGGSWQANLAKHNKAGVAAVRDLGHPPDRPLPRSRKGHAPLVVTSGPGLGPRGPGASWLAEPLSGRDELAGAARTRAWRGAALIKLFASGLLDFERPGKVLQPMALSREEMGAAAKTAWECGLPVTAHLSGRETIQAGLELGLDSLEHAFFITDQQLQTMAAKGISWTPTICAARAHAEDAEGRHTPLVRENVARIVESHLRSVVKAEEFGVTLVLGTDAGSYGVEHGSAVFVEMEAWLEAGLRPQTVFSAAVSNGARALGIEREVGGIFAGMRAWLLAVGEKPTHNPLALLNPLWRHPSW